MEPRALVPPRRPPRVALALLRVPHAGGGSRVRWSHPEQPRVGAPDLGAGGSRLRPAAELNLLRIRFLAETKEMPPTPVMACTSPARGAGLVRWLGPHVVAFLGTRRRHWGHLKAPAPTCY